MAKPQYRTKAYAEAKRRLRGAPCVWCGAPSDSVDHYPPVSSFPPGRWVGIFRPACLPCQIRQGKQVLRERGRNWRPALPSRTW